MSFDRAELAAALARHGIVHRVVVAEVKGSAPRETGASMLVWPDGQSGTIGGGALEYEAAASARRMNPGDTQIRRAALGPALNQCCGGAVTLVSETFDSVPEGSGPFARRIEGSAQMPLSLHRLISRARAEGAPVPVSLQDGWLIEPARQSRRPLWIFGAGHVGRALVDVLAPLPDFDITWVDTGPERFPEQVAAGVRVLPAVDPATALRLAPENAEILILTYSHALDLALCHSALSLGLTRIGLIGSQTKWARFRTRLGQLGHSQANILGITCPIGDPGLGKHPQAIALGVATAMLRRGAVGHMNERGETG